MDRSWSKQSSKSTDKLLKMLVGRERGGDEDAVCVQEDEDTGSVRSRNSSRALLRKRISSKNYSPTYRLQFKNYGKGNRGSLLSKWVSCAFSVLDNHLFVVTEKDAQKGTYTLNLNIADCRIGNAEIFQEGSVMQFLSRRRGRSVDKDDRRRSKKLKKQFRITNETDLTSIGVSGLESEGVLQLRKALVTQKIVGTVLTDDLDRSALKVDKTLIGSGGAARIYSGTYFGMPIALKRFHEVNIRNEVEYESSLKKQVAELINLKELRHPNIVSVLGAYFEHSTLVVVMERCFGSLQSALHENGGTPSGQSWNMKHFVSVVGGIASGMAFIHARGIIHRDLKPGNILLTNQFQAKITDFGDSRKWATRMSINVGTPIYQAPEQIAAGKSLLRRRSGTSYDKSVDVYAFALVLWEIWTKQVPFSSMKTMSGVEKFVSMGGRPKMRCGMFGMKSATPKGAVLWPKTLSALVQRCWHQNPDARPTFETIREEWNESFSIDKLRQMRKDGTALPWFHVPRGDSRGRHRKRASNMSTGSVSSIESPSHTPSATQKRMSRLCSEDLYHFLHHKSQSMKHRGLAELASLVQSEDIDGPELSKIDEPGLGEVGLYEKISSERRRKMKREQVLDLLKSFREETISHNLISPKRPPPLPVIPSLSPRRSSEVLKGKTSTSLPLYTYSDDIDLRSNKMQKELADVKAKRTKLKRATIVKLKELADLRNATTTTTTTTAAAVSDSSKDATPTNATSKSDEKRLRSMSTGELATLLRDTDLVDVAEKVELEGVQGDDFADFVDDDLAIFGLTKAAFENVLGSKHFRCSKNMTDISAARDASSHVGVKVTSPKANDDDDDDDDYEVEVLADIKVATTQKSQRKNISPPKKPPSSRKPKIFRSRSRRQGRRRSSGLALFRKGFPSK
eukprot:g2814.t1